MYSLNSDNLRDIIEEIMGDSPYLKHALYAIRFMAENLHTGLSIDKPYTTSDPDGDVSGLFQKLSSSEKSYYLGFIDMKEGLAAIAKGFAGEEFEDSREFILDAAGETINRINGDFVIAQAKSGIDYTIEPQLFIDTDEPAPFISYKEILHIPIKIGDYKAEILFITL